MGQILTGHARPRVNHRASGIPPSTAQGNALSGPTTLGAWISPEGLARLQPGQQLDRNPVTGVILTVRQPGRAANGKVMVVLPAAIRGGQIFLP